MSQQLLEKFVDYEAADLSRELRKQLAQATRETFDKGKAEIQGKRGVLK